VAEVHRRSQLRQPTTTPRPAAGNRVQNPTNEQLTQQERPETDALADGANNDVSGGLHEHNLKQCQDIAARVIRRTDQKESLASYKSPLPTANQKMIQRGDAPQIGRRCINGHRAKLECVSHRVVGEESEHVRREVQHHQMRGVFLSNQPAGQQRKPGLHEQNQVACVQRPRKVGGHANVPHTVGKLNCQRFLGCLCLVIVEGLLVRGVVGSRLIGWLDRDEGISGAIDGCRLVPGRRAGRIRFGSVVGKTQSGRPH